MVFFCNLLFSLIWAYCVDRTVKRRGVSDAGLFVLLLPLFAVWLVICGGQYYVGTDYGSYMRIFKGNLAQFELSGEIGFAFVVRLFNSIGVRGQALFYVFFSLNFFFFYLLLKRIKNGSIFIYILLYITVTSLFNNQLNTLRQATTIYMGTYASLLLFENRRWRSLLVLLLAISIHKSSIIYLLLIFYKRAKALNRTWLLATLIACFTLGMFFSFSDLLMGSIPYLPKDYAWHIQSDSISEYGMLNKVTKLIFIPLYVLAVWSCDKFLRDDMSKTLFNIGVLSFCLRLLLINISIVYRLSASFLLLSIFPLYYYMYYLYTTRKTFIFGSVTLGLLLLYFLKAAVYPSGEYLYHSIYF